MEKILGIVQLALAVLLIAAVLLQQQGGGAGAAFGGGAAVRLVRRGPEKLVFRATIVISFLLFILSLAIVILQ